MAEKISTPPHSQSKNRNGLSTSGRFYVASSSVLRITDHPERYYNVPPGDPFGSQTELDVFQMFEPLDDRLDAAMCTGSGWLARRAALQSIGGLPQVDAGDDFLCSSSLSSAGWKVAFVPEQMQAGLAPESLQAHVKQRAYWVSTVKSAEPTEQER